VIVLLLDVQLHESTQGSQDDVWVAIAVFLVVNLLIFQMIIAIFYAFQIQMS
jgi:hypothetical protein